MRILGIAALLLSLLLSACMAVLLTEAGQLLNVPLDWPLAVLANRLPAAMICLVALDLADARLPNKEKVWAITGDADALAISRDYFHRHPVINETVGGEPVVIAYYPEYGTVGGFSRELEGEVLQVTEIDAYGNTPQGKLRRIDMFSEVYWMVWAHFHPGARLLAAGM
jgi:hypothetical protein